ncbi:unnamed protein product [Rotaria sordida]|uniref:Complex III assembly factor LYRM7 n=1 Tax=Rotaria sordida TaxID=392033 RepID=A0A813W6L7_9BILA|nr:unnamed protein product [Rotaria sordida]CAF0851568.1 unnamed protein product [Rotaria sordida]CAF1330022.1 unnamed protein product [Rotaria sordida]CAF1499937.1 unnamed protein product [Rotaria sordida]CAF1654773.1 unnamed protein product [Rotaria sordida]
MGTSLRSQVLAHYKKLLHTAQVVFQNDPPRIASMTQGIRENFAHYKNVTDEKTIKELIRAAKDTDSFLRREILQTIQTDENTYRLVVKPYMLFDNTRLIRECEDDEKAHHEEEEKARQQGLSPCELAAQK